MPRSNHSLVLGGHYCVLAIGLVLFLCLPYSTRASNYFAYIHGREPSGNKEALNRAPTDRPISVFKSKVLRLCTLYARGQRAQQRLIASLDVDGSIGSIGGRRLDEPPQICRPVLQQLQLAAEQAAAQAQAQAAAMATERLEEAAQQEETSPVLLVQP